ncbi:MerR family transcriptional regulator [Actinocatenispora rupis]|nr:MerR family transcriptional regulator [Actinocatenispora rupis]
MDDTDTARGTGSEGLSIQQVARRTGLSQPTLRYYEQIGLIDPVDRDPSSGHRRYYPRAVERIESLAHLRAAGLPIEDMRTLMRSRGHRPETIQTKLELLTAHRDTVASEIAALTTRRSYLDNRIAYWQAVLAGDDTSATRLTEEGQTLGDQLH